MLGEAFAAIEGIVRRPARLVGHRFRTVPEYPDFSWQEAVLNAVAHRDYLVEGRTTEVWFFDDRLEFEIPGVLRCYNRIQPGRQTFDSKRALAENPELERYLKAGAPFRSFRAYPLKGDVQ